MATPLDAIVPQNLWSGSVNHRLGEMPLDFSNGRFSLIPVGGVSLNWSDRTLISSTESFEITLDTDLDGAGRFFIHVSDVALSNDAMQIESFERF